MRTLDTAPASYPAASLKSLTRAAGAVLTSYQTWMILGLAWAALYSFADRYTMNPDGMSYIDIASDAVRSGPAHLINGYWSPGYPAVLAIFLAIFRPSLDAVYPVVHLANFCIFVLAMLSFAFFLKHWIAIWDRSAELKDTGSYLIPFGFGVFLWHSIDLIGVAAAVPDLFVAGICFLVAGILCRASIPGSHPANYAALGAILALGYYFKSSMFPIGLLGLAVFWVAPPTRFVKRRYMVLAAIMFLVVSAPLAIALSYRAGKPTVGEAGRLNYVWLVNRFQIQTGWTEAGDHGIPEHAPRKLLEKPHLLEFAEPVSGTYPLWYDPGYWYAGVKPKFDWRQQWEAIAGNAPSYGQILRYMNALVAGALLLCVLALRDGRFAMPSRRWVWQLVWPLAVFCLYWLVYVETRYVAPFFVLLWLAVYGILIPRVAATPRKVILASVVAVMLIPSLLVAGTIVRSTFSESSNHERPVQYKVAAALQAMGLRAGDRVAIVGPGFETYYAQIAGLKIVAQIPSEDEFLHLNPSELATVTAHLSALGVKALIAKKMPLSAASEDWRQTAGYSILSIRP